MMNTINTVPNSALTTNTSNSAQRQAILNLLTEHGSMTTSDFRNCGVFTAPQRISELKKQGWDIKTDRITVFDHAGVKHPGVARYTLVGGAMSIINAPAMQAHNKDIESSSSIVLENQSNNSNLSANVTVITSHKPSQLTKVISLSKEGKMVKTASAQLIEGNADTTQLTTISDFATLLTTLAANQALVYGVPNDDITTAKVVTKDRYEQLGANTQGFIPRTKEHFSWSSGAGIMMFDYDPDGEALDKKAVLQLLYEVCPAIRDVDHLWWMSSSSNIVNTATGETLSHVTGQRIYVMVNNATDIERAAKVINDKLWLAGHGYVKVSVSGAMLNRVPFDMSVYQPSRLDFAAGAACVAPLQQNRGEPELIAGSLRSLDTLTALPDLNSTERNQVETFLLGEKARANPKAQAAKLEYIETMKDKLLRSDPDMKDEDRAALMTMVLDEKALLPNWVLYVWHEGNLEAITVAELLQNKHYYDGMLCLDPIEPDYDGGYQTSITLSDSASIILTD